ncbi:MAG TPA: twin-arginine translocation signal domain-containing protein [Candidatus Nanopelagicales bacterium]|nr:twin-arginine translocation signal domain-containing protein [Candidatus Nanopelagicales bacterium]
MVCEKTKNLRGNSRRNFLRLTGVMGAVLGLDQAKILNVIADVGGTALAQEGVKRPRKMFVINDGAGGLAWYTQLWPWPEIATSTSAAISYFQPNVSMPGDTDIASRINEYTPWKDRGRSKQVSVMMSGVTETHTNTPVTSVTVGNNRGLMAAAASIQTANSSLVPVIGITPFVYGAAQGAPGVTTVGNPDGMVELFNSAASQFAIEADSDPQLYEAMFKAQAGLLKAADRPTVRRHLDVGRSAASFLGRNLSEMLRPSQDDLARYELGQGVDPELAALGRSLIIAAKAFRNNLTQMVISPGLRGDPHGAFNNLNGMRDTVRRLGLMFDRFLEDLDEVNTATNAKHSDEVVMLIHGDTPKNPRNRDNWGDGTAGNSNWVYVMGNGRLKTGPLGVYTAQNGGPVHSVNPATGNPDPNRSSASTAPQVGAAVLYALSGDHAVVERYYTMAESYKGYVKEDLDG